jgi:hypothetical protein
MGISYNTVVYAFGDDRKDPIHFSADERDMEVVCHHDEIVNWVWPREFRQPSLLEYELWKQADLPVLSVKLVDGINNH